LKITGYNNIALATAKYSPLAISKNEKMNWRCFWRTPPKQVKEFPLAFTDYLSRDEASEIIKNCNPTNALESAMKLRKYLLS